MGVSLRPRVGIGSLVLGLAFCLAMAATAGAHGSDIRIDDNYGPYHIIAAVGPGLTDEDFVVTIILTEQQTETVADPPPVVGAAITTTLDLPGHTPQVRAVPPEPTLASSGYYEVSLPILGDGLASITLDVSGPAGPASAAFSLPLVRPPNPLLDWLIWGLVAVIIGSAVFIAYNLYGLRRDSHAKGSEQD